MKEKLLLIYGSNLDHSNIKFLVKDRLSKFQVKSGYIPRKTDRNRDILFQYDIYDVNFEKHKISANGWGNIYLISERQLEAFNYSISKLNTGTIVYCKPTIRGHYAPVIDGVEYNAILRRTADEKSEIFFIDYNSNNNKNIWHKLHLLPYEIQFLIIDYGLSYEEKELKVKKWIEQILMLLK